MSVVETFELLIRSRSARELVPFLLALPKSETVAVRKKAKSLERELNQFREDPPGNWSVMMTTEQRFMLLLAGLKTYSRQEALGPGLVIWHEALEGEYADLLWKVLDHARPDWLQEMLMQQAASSRFGTPDYQMLRRMEAEGLISFDAGLYAAAAALVLQHLGNALSSNPTVPANAAEVLTDQLRADSVFITRDLPLAFDFDTAVDNAAARVQVRMTPEDRQQWTWQTWNQMHPVQVVTWQDVLARLVGAGAVPRADVLTRSLLALRRDSRRPLLSWFKNLFLALQPTPAERLERQQELVELLVHQQAQVVNFALDQLKDLWTVPEFAVTPLLVYADGLMTRQDVKLGIRTLLGGFPKLLQRDPAWAPELGRLSAAALAHADAAVQERAAKVLATLLSNDKLAPQELAVIQVTISQYADLLTPTARTILASWLATPTAALPSEAPEVAAYVPSPAFTPELSAETAVPPVQDWHELLFLTGQVLQHSDPLLLERWVDGLLRLEPHYPPEYAVQLQPYLVRAFPSLRGKSGAALQSCIAGHNLTGHSGLVQALLLSWAQGFTVQQVLSINVRGTYTADPLVGVEQLRLAAAETLLERRQGLPLLSTPTHAPHWVAPSVLVQRLLAYEQQGTEPDGADLAVALARTAFGHTLDSHVAQAELPKLQHEGLRELLQWFLSPEPAELPVHIAPAEALRQNTTGAALTSLNKALPWLWAVAARTKHPNEQFEQLQGLAVSDYPGVELPWKPAWAFSVENAGTPYRFTKLEFPDIYTSSALPSPLLLYAQHARSGTYYSSFELAVDYPFLAAMLPNNPSPLHWHVMRCAGWADKVESAERDAISQALRSLVGPGPVHEEATSLLVALGIVHGVPICRALGVEVLLSAVTEGRLVPEVLGRVLGQFIATEFAPAQRLSDTLTAVKGMNPTTDNALWQVLTYALVELPAAPPRNTRKLLELYLDFSIRTSSSVPPTITAKLPAWSTLAPLKKAVQSLLTTLKSTYSPEVV